MNLIPHHPYEQNTREDQWEKLKAFTDARIALGRAGCSIPTKSMLDFQLAHAQARDAVYQVLDTQQLQQNTQKMGLQSLWVQSQANDKEEYLKRPDLGRLLNKNSLKLLEDFKSDLEAPFDVCIVAGDGLSARAIEENAIPLIGLLKDEIEKQAWSLAPIIFATGSRVALGDQVAEALKSKMLIMLIGERPGLSSPDSLGIYYTYDAQTGSLDSKRNCISNIRPAGLSIQIATQRLMQLMINSKNLGYSGVNLKDEHEVQSVEQNTQSLSIF